MPHRVQASFLWPSVELEWAATASSAMAASTGCTRNAVGSSAWKKEPDYRCTRCQGIACPLDGRPQEVQLGPDKLEVVASFCYLGDMLSAAGGCELSTTTRVKTAWKKFKDLLPVLSSHHLSENTWLCVQLLCAKRYAPCQWDLDIDKAKPPASAAKWQGNDQTDLQCQAPRNCHHQIQWASCATWHWGSGPHSEGENDGMDMWKQLTGRDCREWKLSDINPHDRRTWRSGVRSAIRAASQLSGRGAHWCGCCLCMLIKNPIMIWYDMSI